MAEVKIESTTGSRPGTRILRLSGPFTFEGAVAFQPIADSLSDPIIIVDLTEVPYMDSAALGSIMSLYKPSQEQQRQCAVVGACDRLLNMFHLARVDDILLMYRTVEEAQRKLSFKTATNRSAPYSC